MLPALKQDWLDSPQAHYDQLHTSAHGTVIVWERASSPGGSYWHKIQPDDTLASRLLSSQAGQPDRYITVNEFHQWRMVRLLKSLRACYVDIDGCTDLDRALDMLASAGLPAPTMAVFSGRGLHLYWVHEPVPKQALPVWQRCQDLLIAALKPIGADPVAKDCARVLRLMGSINSKTNTEVRGVVFDETPWHFRDLCNEILGYREERPKAKVYDLATMQVHKQTRPKTGSVYGRWFRVYEDLLTIAQWHKKGGIPEGHRNNWLFLAAVALGWFANAATLRDELTDLAHKWTPGLGVNEVKAALQQPLERAARAAEGKLIDWDGSDVDPRYRYKRETLFEMMEPLIPTEKASELRAIVSGEIKKVHHAEAKRTHEAKRDRVAEGRHKVKREAYEAQSEAKTKPWEALGLSRRTYYRKKSGGKL